MLRPCGFLHALVSRQLGSNPACSVFVGSLSRPLVSLFRRLRRPSRIYVSHVLRSRRLVLRFGANTHQFDAHVFFGGHVGACRSRPFVRTSSSVRRASATSRLTFHSFLLTCLRFAFARPSPPISLLCFLRSSDEDRPFFFFFLSFFFFSEAFCRGLGFALDVPRTEVELAEGPFPDLLSQSILVADAQVHRFDDDVFVV